ncbi:Diaminopimelate epimerase [Koleobacter methoxysyntrophicus]|uniref:Diaminopimelate epimerase n=1 Tax=Koleobacter methoxysyntrophicus TaxID=2751313 RepID=A0A8A0RIK7_9FIRM|nr:diaminopimelate epimerase [Koleobacter methoxysyntrophicus]QSQ08053.1 Diaminopimelate epimerase [Koleobacter methoxysyntrophicus]
MDKTAFTKMSGCGNDFIIIDNRLGNLEEDILPIFSRRVCKRRVSMGADGVLVLENSLHADFKMRLFNRDGSEGEMCGNGARCIARYAFVENIAPRKMVFETLAGNIYAEVGEVLVKIKMGDIKINGFNEDRKVNTCKGELICNYIIAGVPHCVIFIKDLDGITDDELRGLGKEIRFNKEEFPEGTNVVPLLYSTSTSAGLDPMVYMFATIGAVFAGAVFGDHCSPISDTTIMSSMFSGADHIDHVNTQIPYAILAAVGALVGYLGVALGLPIIINLIIAAVISLGLFRILSKPILEPGASDYSAKGDVKA